MKPIRTLKDILDNCKLAEKQTPIYKDLQDQPLRLCIDGKQIVEIEGIEIIPRSRDLTLFITSSKNVGYTGDKRELREPMPKETNVATPDEAQPKIITQNDLIQTFNKEDGNKREED